MLVLRGSWNQHVSMAPVLWVCTSHCHVDWSLILIPIQLLIEGFIAFFSPVWEGWHQSPGGESRQARDHWCDFRPWALWRHPLRCGKDHQEWDRQPNRRWQGGDGDQCGRQAQGSAAQVCSRFSSLSFYQCDDHHLHHLTVKGCECSLVFGFTQQVFRDI